MGLLKNGWKTLYDFAEAPGIELAEIEVTPFGLSGRGPIDQTNMRNETVTTAAPKSLKTAKQGKFTAAYDPAVLDTLMAMIQVNQLITITHPNGATWAFWGFIDDFTVNPHKEGERPTAEVVIEPTNLDDNDEETLPVYTAP